MSKLNIILDWNYLLHKSLAVYYSSAEEAKLPKLSTEEDKSLFARKIILDLCAAIRNFENLNKIILTVDSHSWRKDIEIEENAGYKSNRIQTNEVDWNGFYEVSKELMKIVNEHGIITSQIYGAEGDDLMYLFSKYFLENNEDSIVLTGDKDMWQIINDTDNKNFISIFVNNAKFSKVIVTENIFNKMNRTETIDFETLINESSGMDNISNLKKLADNKDITVYQLDKLRHSFDKIFNGDSGDGVPGVFTWDIMIKNGKIRTYRLTPKKIQKIWEYMKLKYSGKDLIYKLPDEYLFIYDEIDRISKNRLSKSLITKEKIKEKLLRNIKLMYLDIDVIPKKIVNKFEEEFEKIKNIKNQFNVNDFRVDILLKDTKYQKTNAVKTTTYFNNTNVKFNENDFFFDENDKLTLN